ncbi:MAG: hypothetical protein U1F43_00915 [Myxococcota bacterium]
MRGSHASGRAARAAVQAAQAALSPAAAAGLRQIATSARKRSMCSALASLPTARHTPAAMPSARSSSASSSSALPEPVTDAAAASSHTAWALARHSSALALRPPQRSTQRWIASGSGRATSTTAAWAGSQAGAGGGVARRGHWPRASGKAAQRARQVRALASFFGSATACDSA